MSLLFREFPLHYLSYLKMEKISFPLNSVLEKVFVSIFVDKLSSRIVIEEAEFTTFQHNEKFENTKIFPLFGESLNHFHFEDASDALANSSRKNALVRNSYARSTPTSISFSEECLKYLSNDKHAYAREFIRDFSTDNITSANKFHNHLRAAWHGILEALV